MDQQQFDSSGENMTGGNPEEPDPGDFYQGPAEEPDPGDFYPDPEESGAVYPPAPEEVDPDDRYKNK